MTDGVLKPMFQTIRYPTVRPIDRFFYLSARRRDVYTGNLGDIYDER